MEISTPEGFFLEWIRFFSRTALVWAQNTDSVKRKLSQCFEPKQEKHNTNGIQNCIIA